MRINIGQLQKISDDILWDLPENRTHGGNVAILIGNSDGFRHSSIAYESAFDTTKVNPRLLLPKSIAGLAAALPNDQVYAYDASARSTLNLQSLPHLRAADTWADALLLPSGMGRNSETTLLLSKFLADAYSPLVLGGESANLALIDTWLLKRRSASVLVTSFGNLQKASVRREEYPPIVGSEPLSLIEEKMAEMARQLGCGIVTERTGSIIMIDQKGQSCSIAVEGSINPSLWQAKISGRIAALLSKRALDLNTLQTAVFLNTKSASNS